MRAGCCHESDVALQIVIRQVAPVGIQGFDQEGAELQVQRVLAGLKELMVMDASFAPGTGLIVKNVALFIERTIGRAPKDAVRMRILGGNVIGHSAIVPLQSQRIVIPVNRHCERIPDEEPEYRSLASRFVRDRLSLFPHVSSPCSFHRDYSLWLSIS